MTDANRSFLAGQRPRRRHRSQRRRRPDAARHARYRPAAAHHPRRPAGLCQGRRRCRDRAERRPSTGSGTMRATGQRQLGSASRRSASRSPSGPAPTRSSSRRTSRTGSKACKVAADPRRRRGRRHARLRRDRQREGQRAAVSSRPRDGLDRRADRDRDRLARGAGDAGRHPDHDPADAVRRLADGLHDQPRQPVRADLLDRHPGRRRHRRGREHRPPLGDEGRAAARAGRDRGGGGGRQPDHRRDADRGRRAAADAVRVRADGALHGADPGQCLGGDAVLVLRRGGGGALADAAAGAKRRPQPARAHAHMAKAALGPVLPARRHADRPQQALGLDLPARRRRRDAAVDARCSTPRPSRSSCCRSTTSPRSRSCSTCPKAQASKRPSACCSPPPTSPARCRRSPRSRPMPARRRRSISTAWSATIICARRPNWAICRSILPPRASASAPATRSRSICAQRLEGAALPAGTSAQGRRGAARPAGAGDAAGRNLRPGRRRRAARSPPRSKKIFARVPFIVDVDDSIGEPRPRLRLSIDQDALEFFGVEQRDVYDTIQALFGGVSGRLFASRRGPQSDRDRGQAAEARPRPGPRRLPRRRCPPTRCPAARPSSNSARSCKRDRRGGSPVDLPPRRPLRRHGDGRTRRPLRGADLRHAGGRQRASTRTTGARCRSP